MALLQGVAESVVLGCGRSLALAGTAAFLCCACSHLDPYAAPGSVGPGADDRRRVLAPLPIAAPDYRDMRYVSALHDELERVDEHRLRLQAIVIKIGSERDLYDAALWLTVPLLAFSPAPKDVTRGAAVLGAGYAWLESRPKELVPIYERAIGELTCLMVAYSPYLYTNKDFGALAASGHTSQRYADLLEAIKAFEKHTAEFIGTVRVRAPADIENVVCADMRSPECAVRKQVRTATTPGNQPQIDRYRDYTGARASAASEEARNLAMLEDHILHTVAQELSTSAHLALGAAGARARAAQPPAIAFDTFLKRPPSAPPATDQTATTQSGAYTERPGAGLPRIAASGKSSADLRAKADEADRTLADARRAAQAFIAKHQARIEQSRKVAQAFCTPYLPAVTDAAAPSPELPSSRQDWLER